MKAKGLILLLLLLMISTRANKREVRWWMAANSLQSNLDFILENPDVITGVYTYASATVLDDGQFTCVIENTNCGNNTWMTSHLQPYVDLNLTVTPALGLTNRSLVSGAALKGVNDVVLWAKSQKNIITGLMLDFEPDTSNSTWVEMYSDYVRALSEGMHSVGMSLEMCTAAWGILDGHSTPEGYGIFSKTGVDVMMSMSSTYFGTNITKNKENVMNEIEQGVSLSQLAVGIGTMISSPCPTGEGKRDYEWTEADLRSFTDWIGETKDIRRLDFWRADIDNEGDCTEKYYFDVARNFLNLTT